MSYFPSLCLCLYHLPRRPCYLENTPIPEDFSNPTKKLRPLSFVPNTPLKCAMTSPPGEQECPSSSQSPSRAGSMSYTSWHPHAPYQASNNHWLIMTIWLPDPVNTHLTFTIHQTLSWHLVISGE